MLKKTAIIGQLLGIDWDTEEDEVVKKFGQQTAGFIFSYFVSLFGAGVAMAMFLKTGPCGIIPEGWSKATIGPLSFCFVSVCLTLAVKMVLLRDMVPGSTGRATAERAAVWATFLLLPQLLLSILALGLATGWRRLLPTIAQFPALLTTPLLTPLTFGPHTKPGYVALSPKLTLVNAGLTVAMAAAMLPVAGHCYAADYGQMARGLGILVLDQVVTLTLALALQYLNGRIAKFLELVFDIAILNVDTGESEAEV